MVLTGKTQALWFTEAQMYTELSLTYFLIHTRQWSLIHLHIALECCKEIRTYLSFSLSFSLQALSNCQMSFCEVGKGLRTIFKLSSVTAIYFDLLSPYCLIWRINVWKKQGLSSEGWWTDSSSKRDKRQVYVNRGKPLVMRNKHYWYDCAVPWEFSPKGYGCVLHVRRIPNTVHCNTRVKQLKHRVVQTYLKWHCLWHRLATWSGR